MNMQYFQALKLGQKRVAEAREYMIFPLLIISGIGLILGIVLLNYKVKHSKRDKGKFKRTNTKAWDT